MKARQRFGAVGLVAASLVFSAACPRQSILERRILLPPGFEVRLENVTYERMDARGRASEAKTANVLLSPSTGVARFERAEVTLRADAEFGEAVEVVTGGGSANLYTGKVSLREGVRLRDGTGRVLDSPSAAYAPEDRSVAGPGPAVLHGANYMLRAETGFVLDLTDGVVDLLGPITGYVEDVSDKP